MNTAKDVDEVAEKLRKSAVSGFGYFCMDQAVFKLNIGLPNHRRIEAKGLTMTALLQDAIDQLNVRKEG
jgi:hypothetical protein